MFIIDALITVAPFIGYYSQYALMIQNQSVGTFSIDICLILIVANVLRIFFWFTTGFANNLLLQSFLVIGLQFLILDLCIKLGYKSKENSEKEGFWRWNSLRPFIIFTMILAFVVSSLTAIFIHLNNSAYGMMLGLASLSIQATLAFPQLITNQKNRTVEGLSVFMIITWFLGDFFKTIYFIVQNQPFQFILSGSVQLTVDTLILIQIMAFKQTTKEYHNVMGDHQQEIENNNDMTVDESDLKDQILAEKVVKNKYDPIEDDTDVHGI